MASAVANRVIDMLSGTSTPKEFYDGLTAREVEILKLIEVEPPADAVAVEAYDYVPAAWATRWPSEEIWSARKR